MSLFSYTERTPAFNAVTVNFDVKIKHLIGCKIHSCFCRVCMLYVRKDTHFSEKLSKFTNINKLQHAVIVEGLNIIESILHLKMEELTAHAMSLKEKLEKFQHAADELNATQKEL